MHVTLSALLAITTMATATAVVFQVPFVLPESGETVAFMPASHTNACPSPMYITRVVAAGNVSRQNTQPLTEPWRDLVSLDDVLETCPDQALCSSASVVPTQLVCAKDDYTLVYDVLWCALPHMLATFPRGAWPNVVHGATADGGFPDEDLFSYDSGFRASILPGFRYIQSTCATSRILRPVSPSGPAVAFQRLIPAPPVTGDGGPDNDAAFVGVEAPFRWPSPSTLGNGTRALKLHGVWVHNNATLEEEVEATQNASAVAASVAHGLSDDNNIQAIWDLETRAEGGWAPNRIPTAAASAVSLAAAPTPTHNLVFGPGTPASVAVTACAQHEDCVAVLAMHNNGTTTADGWTVAAVSDLTLLAPGNSSSSSNNSTYAILSICSLEPYSFPVDTSSSYAPHINFCPRVTATTTTCVSPLQTDAWVDKGGTSSCACRPEWAQPNVLVPVPDHPYLSISHPSQTCVSCAAPLFLEAITVGIDAVPSLVLAPAGETHICLSPTDPEYVNPCGQWGVVRTSSVARLNPLDYTCVCFGVYSFSYHTRTCECAAGSCGDAGTCQTTNVTTVPGCVCDAGYGNADPEDNTSPCTTCDTGFMDVEGDCEAIEDVCPGPFLSTVATQIRGGCVYVLPDLRTDACFVEHGVVGNDGGRPCFNPRVWCGEGVDDVASIAAGHCVCDGDTGGDAGGRGDCRPCTVSPEEGCAGEAACGSVHFATPLTGGCDCIHTCSACVSEDYEHVILADGSGGCVLRAARTHANCGALGTIVPGPGDAVTDTAWTCTCHSNSNKSASALAVYGSQAPCDTCQHGAVAFSSGNETFTGDASQLTCVLCTRPCKDGTGPCELNGKDNQMCPGCQTVLGRHPNPVPFWGWDGDDASPCGACLPGYAEPSDDSRNGSAACVPCPGANDATRERDAAVCTCQLTQSRAAEWTPGPGWARNPTTEECNVCAPGFSGEGACVACDPECPPGVPCAWSGNDTYCACTAGFRLPPSPGNDDDAVCGPCVSTHASRDDGTCGACPRTTCDWEHATCSLVIGAHEEARCACDTGYAGDDCDTCAPAFVATSAGDCTPCPDTCPLPVCLSSDVCDCAAAGRLSSSSSDDGGGPVCGPCERGLQATTSSGVCDIECPAHCSGAGDCVREGRDGNATCVCDTGFVGAACDACDSPTYIPSDNGGCLLCPIHCDYDAPCVQRSPTQAGCDCATVHRVDGPTLSLCGVACNPPWSGRACNVLPGDTTAAAAIVGGSTTTTLGCPLSCGTGGTCLPEWHCACPLGTTNVATGTINETCVPCPLGNASVVNPVTCVVCSSGSGDDGGRGCGGAMLCGHDGVCRVGGVFVPPPLPPVRHVVIGAAAATSDNDSMRDVKSATVSALAMGLPALLLFGGAWGVAHAIAWCVRSGAKQKNHMA